MEENSTKTPADGTALFAGEAWFDPIEAGIRERVRGFVKPRGLPDMEELVGQELEAALGRGRYERDAKAPKGHRNGTRERQLLGLFGPVRISVPRARMTAAGGGAQEWRSASLPRYARMGVRRDGQTGLLTVKDMGGESEAAWRDVLDGLIARGLRTPDVLMADGGAGLERALAALWPEVPAQRCRVHKHRGLLARAPDALHEEVTETLWVCRWADYADMIYAETAKPVEAERKALRKAFLRKWRLRCPACAVRRWPQAWKRPATACLLSSACPRRSGSRHGPPTPLNGCTRSSSAAPRRRPCCPRPRPPPCCSGHCSRQAQRQTLRVSARSPCAR